MRTYGIISDIHDSPIDRVGQAMTVLKDKGAQALVLNGDINGDRVARMTPATYLSLVLDYAGRTGLETFIQPGSHEDVLSTEDVIKSALDDHPNLVYAIRQPKIEANDHQLVFLPGSDWRFGHCVNNGYALEESGQETGFYRHPEGMLHITSMADLTRLVTQPERTVLFCHVPRKFSRVDTGVDYAHFAETIQVDFRNEALKAGRFRYKSFFVRKGLLPALPHILAQAEISGTLVLRHVGSNPSEDAIIEFARGHQDVRALANVVVEQKQNRGNQRLEQLCDGIGLRKYVNGHFHEAAHRAHDAAGDHVPQGTWAAELFWNASYLDGLKVGLLRVDDVNVAYENIVLPE